MVGQAAKLLAENGPTVILFGSGITHYPSAPDTVRLICDLAGSLEPRAGLLPLLGAANLLGALQAGAAALSSQHDYTHIVKSIGSGTVKALYLAGEMPALEELASLELLVVQDSFLSPQAAQFAHVVLPAASFAEVSGTLTNLEGRPQHFEPVIPLVGESLADGLIVCQLAQAMGLEGFQFEQAGEEMAAHGRYRSPVGVRDMGTHMGAPVQQVASEISDQGSANSNRQSTIRNPQSSIFNPQFTLLVERNQFSYRGSALTRRVRGMERVKSDEGALMLNPADAAQLGVQDGEGVCVTSAYGSDTLRVQITPDMARKTAFTSINSATGSTLFPGRLPEVKAYAVKLERIVSSDD
jgi:predicted molibdopterin-dependent oxidoreductase YjgC